ncbi:UDP-glucose/GDP-mannose dehydrogenase [[Clostridium] sordellii]|uniref:nucleotide sugar dehydrogenase n=1 Tax=Paraclostridium sordellii TaxID=1505 RepID=UPI0005E28ABD|nr:nucleotide sugar dehydrogenase [Paeniclostridium sordellii]QYE97354.1 nucleotide sugar dehydrogenase [Paeniclostridium sordellii]CEN83639.1 UDP-glucose/GDP-mannose dehydrogenase [[Clostridium] sordellii] [Paeniclostridium sordellii]CEQ23242.1 UDP-glucose/GDP-mannose dehydrogenase [[Clostridium] sordellii] [Paeniclostridium sordellii]CEQ23923.1 UDP-glucose/GDP-mannose dehydrogenase [[Clostridium] sordellii] [Paeniclostridium sordellii]
MVNIIGLGYIGLPTALILAKSGVKVIGTDYNKELVDTLNNGKLTFEEDGLNELFNEALQNKIEFKTEYVKSSMYIVAVPTPYVSESKKIDPKYVISSINSVLDVCNKESIIVIESTISPGTIDKFIRPEITNRGFIIGKDIHIVHAPERIIPGNMIYELKNNSRTIGADNYEVGAKVKELYSSFCKGEIVVTDIRSAEMSKVVENTYRDINIAFANELAKICRVDNMDVYEIIRIANKHPRVNILQPGPGVGGHCISVDPWFLVGDYPDLTNIILTARKINDSMPTHVLSRIRDIMREKGIKDISKIGLYGMTYKEDVDDVRESPTLQLLEKMDEHLAFGVKVYDPFVKERIVDHQFMNFEDFLNEIEVLVILVAHTHIKENIENIKDKFILDTKNICDFDRVYKL